MYCTLEEYKKITEEELEAENAVPERKKKLQKRTIQHEKFRNIDYDETKEYLSTKNSGEYVFRPSSEGVGFLSLTIKLQSKPMILMSEKILERGREDGDYTLSLRTPLRLNKKDMENEEYEDLDEVVGRFIEPILNRVDAVKSHKKFIKGTKQEISRKLKKQMLEGKGKFAKAGFSLDEEHNGYLRLSSIKPRKEASAKHARIAILPHGFKLRDKVYETIELLYHAFAKDPDAAMRPSAPRRGGDAYDRSSYGSDAYGSRDSDPYGGSRESDPYGGSRDSDPYGGSRDSDPYGRQSDPYGGGRDPYGDRGDYGQGGYGDYNQGGYYSDYNNAGYSYGQAR